MLTTGDGIWIFIICVGIPLGYGIGYFGPLLILDLWAHHKKDCGGPTHAEEISPGDAVRGLIEANWGVYNTATGRWWQKG